jgi:hypothetical protein
MEYGSKFQINDKVVYIGGSTKEIKGTVWKVRKINMYEMGIQNRGIAVKTYTLELESRGIIEKNNQQFYRLATEQEITKDKLKYLFDQVG